MFHPNVYSDGALCLDILQNRWSPSYDVSSILTSIQSLLDEPNPASPANAEAAKLFQENRCEYEKRIQKIVEQSWLDFDDLTTDDEDDEEDDEDEDGSGAEDGDGSKNNKTETSKNTNSVSLNTIVNNVEQVSADSTSGSVTTDAMEN